ncbi:hypothetical protein AB1L30_19230 [Bremerella sp. JC817]|uniref:hypothetical protein n=1 Tax=Bremerella sp. JC817 TaxID=3231756 RepID=UPI003459D8A1
MTSISDSDYKSFCSDLIQRAMEKPGMYFKSLKDLEYLLYGHQEAFEKLGAILHLNGFYFRFADWLHSLTGESNAAGWAFALEELAKNKKEDPLVVFAMLAGQFIAEWRSM